MVQPKDNKQSFFRRIVVPVDGSEPSRKALKNAIFLSKKTKLPLLAMYVIDMNIYSKTLVSDEVSKQWRSVLRNEGESLLHEIDQLAKQSNISIETKLMDGNPGEKIIENIKENDLVIMGSKGKTSMDRIFIGSVSEFVLHHSNCAVMVVR